MAGPITASSREVHDIHDGFFKAIMQLPGNAVVFLKERLPEHLAEQIGDGPVEILPGSFVDETLNQSHTDLLVQVPMKTGGHLLVHFVLEHKSYPEEFTPLQLSGYVVNVLKRWHLEHPQASLPPVVAVLIYNGPTPWPYSSRLGDLTDDASAEVREYMLGLYHVVVDLHKIDDGNLSRSPDLSASLYAFKHGTTPNFIRRHLKPMVVIGLRLSGIARDHYLSYLFNLVGRKPMEAVLKRVAPGVGQDFIRQALQPVYEEGEASGFTKGEAAGFTKGEAAGLAKGEAAGLAKGEAAALRSAVREIVQERFGLEPRSKISDAVERCIATATTRTLSTWVKKLATTASLAEVFGRMPGIQEGSNDDLMVRSPSVIYNIPTRGLSLRPLACVILEVARRRFDIIPDGLPEVLAAAGELTLEHWLIDLVDGKSLEEVFGDKVDPTGGDMGGRRDVA